MQRLYLALCLIGTALPLAQFIPWLAEHGLHLPLFLWLRQRHLDHASSQGANP